MDYDHSFTGFLSGKEKFTYDDEPQDFTVMDFWRFQFSNLSDMQGRVGEFIVAMALGKGTPDNNNGWTLFDIEYRDVKVEVKTTAYFQPWRFKRDVDGHIIDEKDNYSDIRVFSIRKANGIENGKKVLRRWSDIYVFVLNTGKTEKEADPLRLEHWRFWVVRTDVLNDIFGDNKTLSLKRLQKMKEKYGLSDCQMAGGEDGISVGQLKDAVDVVVDSMK